MRRAFASMLALGMLGATGCSMESSRFHSRWEGKPAPDFELMALDGSKVKLSDHRGKPVLLSFWAFG